jgi:hypothetical protein
MAHVFEQSDQLLEKEYKVVVVGGTLNGEIGSLFFSTGQKGQPGVDGRRARLF